MATTKKTPTTSPTLGITRTELNARMAQLEKVQEKIHQDRADIERYPELRGDRALAVREGKLAGLRIAQDTVTALIDQLHNESVAMQTAVADGSAPQGTAKRTTVKKADPRYDDIVDALAELAFTTTSRNVSRVTHTQEDPEAFYGKVRWQGAAEAEEYQVLKADLFFPSH